MGNIFKGDLLLTAGADAIEAPEFIEEKTDTEITLTPSGKAVRLYVTFSKSDGDTLTAAEKAQALKDSLPDDISFEVRRIDETGYAAVIQTTDTSIKIIEENENVESVTVEEEAHTTVSLETSKKNESEGLEGKETEEVEETVDESITVDAIENELGNLETQTVLNVNVDDHADSDLAKGPIVLSIGLAVILFVGLFFLFLRKKR